MKKFNKYQFENISTIKKEGNKGRFYDEIWVRLYDPNTKESFFREVTELCIPNIYIPSSEGQFRSYLDGRPLKEITFESTQERKKFTKKLKKKTGEILELINDEGEAFEIEEEIWEDDAHGYDNPRHTFIHRYFPKPLESNHLHRTWFIDIETFSGVETPGKFPHAETAYERVSMIQIYDNFTDQYIIVGYKPFIGKFEKPNVKYIHIEDEAKMLEFFIRLLEKQKPSIISGFNSLHFDIPYLTNRIARVLDGYSEGPEGLNKRKSYIDMPNVNRLSPLGYVYGKKSKTKDDMEGFTSIWEGILLLDYRELTIKYGYLGLSAYSLNNVSKALKFEGKVDHSNYASFQGFTTGEGYIFPENPTKEELEDEVYQAQLKYKNKEISYEELSLITWKRFTEYGFRDVEILVEIDKKYEYLNTHQGIAYLTSVPMSDNWGTYEQWASYFVVESMKNNTILPLKQQYGEESPIYLAGWTRNVPGKYIYVSSFDFSSLYPSVYKTWNIGTDVMLKPHEIPEELKDLKKKYFNYFTQENLNRNEESGPLGETVIKYDGSINDITDETKFYLNLIENKEEISSVLKKYNVSATPNGYFFRREIESMSSFLMRAMFKDRYFHKQEAQRIFDEMEGLDKASEQYKKLSKEYYDHSLLDRSLKLMLVAFYGAGALSHNQFSSGKLTNACVTISGRMSNRVCSYFVNREINKMSNRPSESPELNNIVQVDTDSLYGCFDSIMDFPKLKNLKDDEKIKFLMKLSSTKIQDVINGAIREIQETLNVRDFDSLQMENEVITKGFVSVASKRYYTRVMVKDGTILEKPKMKITGLDVIGKSTPDYFKKSLNPILNMILDKDESHLIKYIADERERFNEADVREFCRKSKVNNISYDWKNGKYVRMKEDGKLLTAPLGSWASLEHNRIIKEKDLISKYSEIEAGESINYSYIKEPNKERIRKAIAWKDPSFVEDLKINKLVDRESHFEKDFVNKIEIITGKIGWNVKKTTESIEEW